MQSIPDNELRDRVEKILDQALKTNPGQVFVVSGPSGVGKTVICKEVVKRCHSVRHSISYTTRTKRPDEIDGEEYHFITLSQFQSMIRHDEFWEFAEVHGKMYGTSKHDSENIRQSGCDLIMDIDIQGVDLLKSLDVSASYLFVLPPCMEELKHRLLSRDANSIHEIDQRMRTAYYEILRCDGYDFVIVNQDLEQSIDDIIKTMSICRYMVKNKFRKEKDV